MVEFEGDTVTLPKVLFTTTLSETVTVVPTQVL